MRYLATFRRLGPGGEPLPTAENARATFDVTECVPTSDPDHLVPTVVRSEYPIRNARGAPPWVRHWNGAFEAVLTRLDDRRFERARGALVAEEGEGDWHWIRYTNYADGDELRFVRADGAIRHVMFRNDEPVVSSIPW